MDNVETHNTETIKKDLISENTDCFKGQPNGDQFLRLCCLQIRTHSHPGHARVSKMTNEAKIQAAEKSSASHSNDGPGATRPPSINAHCSEL